MPKRRQQTKKLHRYWVKFRMAFDDPHPLGTLLGCGVTAFDRADALALLRDTVFPGIDLPETEFLIEDVDITTLDPNHVLPNMASPSNRGVWFPLGYQQPEAR